MTRRPDDEWYGPDDDAGRWSDTLRAYAPALVLLIVVGAWLIWGW